MIHVGAAAPYIPSELVDMLNAPGRYVGVVTLDSTHWRSLIHVRDSLSEMGTDTNFSQNVHPSRTRRRPARCMERGQG